MTGSFFTLNGWRTNLDPLVQNLTSYDTTSSKFGEVATGSYAVWGTCPSASGL